MKDKNLISIVELGERWGVSQNEICNWQKSGKLWGPVLFDEGMFYKLTDIEKLEQQFLKVVMQNNNFVTK